MNISITYIAVFVELSWILINKFDATTQTNNVLHNYFPIFNINLTTNKTNFVISFQYEPFY